MDSATQRSAQGMSLADPSHESASKMTEEPEAGPDGWKTDDLSVRRASNGGFIVRCSKTKEAPQSHNGGGNGIPASSGRDYKSDELAFSSIDQVLSYISSEFGGSTPGEMPDEGDGDEGETQL